MIKNRDQLNEEKALLNYKENTIARDLAHLPQSGWPVPFSGISKIHMKLHLCFWPG